MFSFASSLCFILLYFFSSSFVNNNKNKRNKVVILFFLLKWFIPRVSLVKCEWYFRNNNKFSLPHTPLISIILEDRCRDANSLSNSTLTLYFSTNVV